MLSFQSRQLCVHPVGPYYLALLLRGNWRGEGDDDHEARNDVQ